ncbi:MULTISPECIES: molybdopterin adenylyltransferase [unclassified Neisseria]|uniref:molybdopterin adenylyltransferase n=1 Tax=unclassified Neisseria TaxID=2623750 RepID=UPI00107225C3|nr:MULTISPECIES: molybdopterin adenylyltransferase [unclassified Neisseria]MBF0803466.1 molybdopterin adenylyltransferase [Neisseria sp. 19428wB4_WF04]TFU43858.1 molybdopterin adenylyltransferase [Neisseria sp. WF04]
MPPTLSAVTIGLVSTSDRASSGVYADEGIPALKQWLQAAVKNPIHFTEALVADEQPAIEAALRRMADTDGCDLIFTTGGTGPAPRDITPEATLAVIDKEMPGFGEQMRRISLHYVPTAVLSRQTAGIRGRCLIVNLPGRPQAIAETLGGVRTQNGSVEVEGLFAAIPYCVELIGGVYIETDAAVCKAFRPKQK